ncbi:MAG: NAD metabolism ATPase/kinase [Bacteroidetes bacterium GWF2_33_16]|nr:MAG: NAD metabolism ATPase/kinase [Bacteroidetes bacterium GWE2_32_14]OFY06006.1 MAG: NAD metabolism ATPase/kinase [Bacteroidetes bacterium GWF2_33_16]
MHIDHKDLLQLKSKGIAPQEFERQIENFKKGFPYVKVQKPAKIGDGILKLTEKDIDYYKKLFDDFSAEVLKFVPASGAATRMFSFLFDFLEKGEDHYSSINQIEQPEVKIFFENIKKFAFYNDLESFIKSRNQSLEELIEECHFKAIIHFLLLKDGLNYSEKPKGIISFHKTEEEIRTSFEEHLVEGALYAKSSKDKVRIHFTILPEHIDLFNEHANKVKSKYEKKYNVTFEITFSQQKSSTDMVAVNENNELFRNDDGSLLFRPGGHGALIENLNDLKDDIIFIKNIDNIVPDNLKNDTINYKKALAGVLIKYKMRIHNYLFQIDEGNLNTSDIKEIANFIKNELCFIPSDDIEEYTIDLQKNYLKHILNRPIRVCGMVKNEGEPGGGPFWVKHKDSHIDLQIIESSQLDPNDSKQQQISKTATHFNPVDLVISAINYKDVKFDLLKYRDHETGFISKKTKDGKILKAQELPGLWNGAMAHWNTIFVEVPISTFNPVKTINDLLRPEHQ